MGKMKTLQTLNEEVEYFSALLDYLDDHIPNLEELITNFNKQYDNNESKQ